MDSTPQTMISAIVRHDATRLRDGSATPGCGPAPVRAAQRTTGARAGWSVAMPRQGRRR